MWSTMQPFNYFPIIYDGLGGAFVREVACFVAEGMGIVSLHTQDQTCHVEFDFPSIWEKMKSCKSMPRMVWMLHTHYPTFDAMSETDALSAKGWASALGIPVEMDIVTKTMHRYLVYKRNVLIDVGTHEETMAEMLLTTVMRGLSAKHGDISQELLDSIVVHLNDAIPAREWQPCERMHSESSR